MGKSKAQKLSYMKKAAAMRAEYQKKLRLFIVLLAIVVIVLFVYMFSGASVLSEQLGMLPWILAVVAAGVIGVLGNKFSRAHREYESYIYAHKIVDEDVKQFVKENKESK